MVKKLVDLFVDFLKMPGKFLQIQILGLLQEDFAPFGMMRNMRYQIVHCGNIILNMRSLFFELLGFHFRFDHECIQQCENIGQHENGLPYESFPGGVHAQP